MALFVKRKVLKGLFCLEKLELGFLPLEAILPSPFICVSIFAIILVMACAVVFKFDGYGFNPLLAGYLDKGSIYWRRARYVNIQRSVHWRYNFFNLLQKLTNQK